MVVCVKTARLSTFFSIYGRARSVSSDFGGYRDQIEFDLPAEYRTPFFGASSADRRGSQCRQGR